MEYLSLSYYPGLLVLGWMVAVFTAYTAIDLIGRSQQGRLGLGWFVLASLAFGLGIWALLYILLASLNTGGVVYYNPLLVGATLLVAILAATAAVFILSRTKASLAQVGLGGLLFFAASGGAFYLGLSSINLGATLSYDPTALAIAAGILLFTSVGGMWATSTTFFRLPARALILGTVTGSALFASGFMWLRAARFSDGVSQDFSLAGFSLLMNILVMAAILLMSLPLFASSLLQGGSQLEEVES